MGEEQAKIAPLPVGPILRESCATVSSRWRQMIAVLWPGAMLMAIAASVEVNWGETSSWGYWIPQFAFALAAQAAFDVPCYRLILIDESAAQPVMSKDFATRVLRYVVAMVTLIVRLAPAVFIAIVAYVAICWPLAYVTGVDIGADTDSFLLTWGFPIFLLPVWYHYVRWGMSLPATAVDQDSTWDRAWKVTSNNGARLLLISVLWFGPTFSASMLRSGDPTWSVEILIFGVTLVTQVLGVTSAALCYRFLTQTRSAETV